MSRNITKKILLSGPLFYNYNEMIANAFKELNCEVLILDWPNLYGNLLDKIHINLSSKILKHTDNIKYRVMAKEVIEYNNKITQQIIDFRPDIVFVINGDILSQATIQKINRMDNCTTVLWCYDTALRKDVLGVGRHFDLLYTYEPSDIPELRKYNILAEHLPMAYDPSIYKMLGVENEHARIDISFVGTLSSHPERELILENIISANDKLNVGVWGKSWNWYELSRMYKYNFLLRKLGACIHNYNIGPNEANAIYNSSKICLNVHSNQSKEGLNPRTFEILGAGGFQLVDYKVQLEELFELGREVVCYRNEKDLLEQIEYYLENEAERKKIAKRGFERVKKEHTYRHRAEKILGDVSEKESEI